MFEHWCVFKEMIRYLLKVYFCLMKCIISDLINISKLTCIAELILYMVLYNIDTENIYKYISKLKDLRNRMNIYVVLLMFKRVIIDLH